MFFFAYTRSIKQKGETYQLADLVQLGIGAEEDVPVGLVLVVYFPGTALGQELPVVLGMSVRTPRPDQAADVNVVWWQRERRN